MKEHTILQELHCHWACEVMEVTKIKHRLDFFEVTDCVVVAGQPRVFDFTFEPGAWAPEVLVEFKVVQNCLPADGALIVRMDKDQAPCPV